MSRMFFFRNTIFACLSFVCTFSSTAAVRKINDLAPCSSSSSPVSSSIASFANEVVNRVFVRACDDLSARCDHTKLPLSPAQTAVTNSIIQSIQERLKPEKMNDNEKFMLSRALILTELKLPGESCPGKGACFGLSSTEGVSWSEKDFWQVVGPQGCEGVAEFMSRIAIDYKMGQVQIGRRELKADYLRFGVDLCACEIKALSSLGYQRVDAAGRHREGWDYLIEQEKKQKQVDEFIPTSSLVGNIHAAGQLTVATLGFARGWLEKGPEYRQKVRLALRGLEGVLSKRGDTSHIGGVITGGYKGEGDNVYGVTRTGHEVAEIDGYYSIVVTPQAGMADTHENPDSRSVVGHLWGDDSKALVGASDVALVFYRSQTHKESPHQMGRWTEIEIEHLRQQGVPYVLVDIDESPGEIVAHVKKRMTQLDGQIPHYQPQSGAVLKEALFGSSSHRSTSTGSRASRPQSLTPISTGSSSGYSTASPPVGSEDSLNDVFTEESLVLGGEQSAVSRGDKKRRSRIQSGIIFNHLTKKWERGVKPQ